MNVTKVETKESTKHCCGNGWGLKDSAEHEGEGRALIDQRITENNSTNVDRCKCQYKNVGFLQNKNVINPTFLFCNFSFLRDKLKLIFQSIRRSIYIQDRTMMQQSV